MSAKSAIDDLGNQILQTKQYADDRSFPKTATRDPANFLSLQDQSKLFPPSTHVDQSTLEPLFPAFPERFDHPEELSNADSATSSQFSGSSDKHPLPLPQVVPLTKKSQKKRKHNSEPEASAHEEERSSQPTLTADKTKPTPGSRKTQKSDNPRQTKPTESLRSNPSASHLSSLSDSLSEEALDQSSSALLSTSSDGSIEKIPPTHEQDKIFGFPVETVDKGIDVSIPKAWKPIAKNFPRQEKIFRRAVIFRQIQRGLVKASQFPESYIFTEEELKSFPAALQADATQRNESNKKKRNEHRKVYATQPEARERIHKSQKKYRDQSKVKELRREYQTEYQRNYRNQPGVREHMNEQQTKRRAEKRQALQNTDSE